MKIVGNFWSSVMVDVAERTLRREEARCELSHARRGSFITGLGIGDSISDHINVYSIIIYQLRISELCKALFWALFIHS